MPSAPLVGADALERADAVVQRVRQDVHLRLREGDEVSVEPDLVDGLQLRAATGHTNSVSTPGALASAALRSGRDVVARLLRLGNRRRARRVVDARRARAVAPLHASASAPRPAARGATSSSARRGAVHLVTAVVPRRLELRGLALDARPRARATRPAARAASWRRASTRLDVDVAGHAVALRDAHLGQLDVGLGRGQVGLGLVDLGLAQLDEPIGVVELGARRDQPEPRRVLDARRVAQRAIVTRLRVEVDAAARRLEPRLGRVELASRRCVRNCFASSRATLAPRGSTAATSIDRCAVTICSRSATGSRARSLSETPLVAHPPSRSALPPVTAVARSLLASQVTSLGVLQRRSAGSVSAHRVHGFARCARDSRRAGARRRRRRGSRAGAPACRARRRDR